MDNIRKELIDSSERVVIKIGSTVLASRQGINQMMIDSLAEEISGIKKEVVIVSSGAIAAGMGRLSLKDRPKEIRLKQAVAAVGQSRLMWAYEKSFETYGKKVAQVLLTREDLSDRRRYLYAKNTLETLIEFGVIPVINENDTVAVDEIRFGDNDTLAVMVTNLLQADLLLILSDVDGLCTSDPRSDSNAKLIDIITDITPQIERIAGESSTIEGTGGMFSKVQAAKKAAQMGVATAIINGTRPGSLRDFFESREVGTFFATGKDRLSLRKHWIAYTLKSKGTLTIDEGAKRAILKGGKSLLPSGITSIEGKFGVGDAVSCQDESRKKIVKGIVNYSSEDLNKIKGMKSSEIEKTLGYKYDDEVIHRDNMVIL
ncbi:MAG: glutamate 5-kinase [Nitrospirota bacterium]